MKDGCEMRQGMLIVDDNTRELRAPSPCLNWKITWQLHDLHKDLDVEHTTSHDGVVERQKNPPRLASSKAVEESIQISFQQSMVREYKYMVEAIKTRNKYTEQK